MGTTVISGSAKMRVIKTGTATAIGAIADSLTSKPPATAFEVGTHRFGLLIMRLTVLLVLFVLLVNAYLGKPWLESFLFAVALAVGLTPELLPMVVSVTLSRGAMHMAQKRVIVKRLAAIQNLGSMDVLRPVNGIESRRSALPNRLVRRIAMHASPGDFHHPHPRQPVQKPGTSCISRHLAVDYVNRRHSALYSAGTLFRPRTATRSVLFNSGSDGCVVSIRGGTGQKRLLSLA